VAQQPIMIGESAVQAAFDLLSGEDVEDFIPVDLELVTE
jgi:ribose transport system substrate-binding protein